MQLNNERVNWNRLHTTKHGKVQNNSRIGFSGLSETKIWQNSKEQIRDYINECPLEKIQPAIIAYDLGMYEHYVAKIVYELYIKGEINNLVMVRDKKGCRKYMKLEPNSDKK